MNFVPSDTDTVATEPPITPVAFALDSLIYAQNHIERALVYAATARDFATVEALSSVRNSLLYTQRFLAEPQKNHAYTNQ